MSNEENNKALTKLEWHPECHFLLAELSVNFERISIDTIDQMIQGSMPWVA